jgi:MOSC domain-containing protein YiiM
MDRAAHPALSGYQRRCRTGVHDLNVPRSILECRGHGDCGIYAEVLPGNNLSLMDDQQGAPSEPHLG